MKNVNEIPEYLLIKNPLNGKHVNVLPLFLLLEENHAAESGSFDNFIKPLQEMQDFLAVDMVFDDFNHENFRKLGNVNCNIVRLRKLFETMAQPV